LAGAVVWLVLLDEEVEADEESGLESEENDDEMDESECVTVGAASARLQTGSTPASFPVTVTVGVFVAEAMGGWLGREEDSDELDDEVVLVEAEDSDQVDGFVVRSGSIVSL